MVNATARIVAAGLLMMTVGGCLRNEPAGTDSGDPQVHLNQVGFYPHAPKTAIVTGMACDSFVVAGANGDIVYSGRCGPPATWAESGTVSHALDFSELRMPGRYRIRMGENTFSPWFDVRRDVLADLRAAALKAFYYNRAGTAIDERFGGLWSRAAGHPDDSIIVHSSAASAERPAGSKFSAAKGWYDAGDYNKYVVNGSYATYVLLAAYEHCPACFTDRRASIPESGNGLPDILDEALWNLDWLMDMQDPADGGVYHKLTTLDFAGFVMPHEAIEPRYAVQKTTAATLDFAAVTAMASRVLRTLDPERSGRLNAAALDAWNWSVLHPAVSYQQPPDVSTGAYAYEHEQHGDERFWAAVELTLTTGATTWLDGIDIEKQGGGVPSWDYVGPLAWISLVLSDREVPELTALARSRILATADFLLRSENAYGITMGAYAERFVEGENGKDFVWGSNGNAAFHGVMLLNAYRIRSNDDYLHAALANVDYLLGRNPLGKSYVTGFGSNSPQNIHHRPSAADGVAEPVPGFLVGGPHSGQQDAGECGHRYASELPALSYLDDRCSYATNEVAINWNAPLVYAVTILEHYLGAHRAGETG